MDTIGGSCAEAVLCPARVCSCSNRARSLPCDPYPSTCLPPPPPTPPPCPAPPCSYPYNLDFDYGPLEGLQKYCINNLGDPFIESNYGVHSREFEIGVLQWFARLWEIEPHDFWGYITNCGTGACADRLCRCAQRKWAVPRCCGRHASAPGMAPHA